MQKKKKHDENNFLLPKIDDTYKTVNYEEIHAIGLDREEKRRVLKEYLDDNFDDHIDHIISKEIKKKDGNIDSTTLVQKYIQNCKRFDISIDPNVVIALTTQWEIIQPTKKMCEGGLLPLIDILENNKIIKKINLASSAMQDSRYGLPGAGNANARALKTILSGNNSIVELDISNTGIDDEGLIEISEGLKNNKTVTSLNLSKNHFGKIGAESLKKALEANLSLKNLDLSRNALGFNSINSLLCSCRSDIIVKTNGNFVFEEVLNAVSHGIGFLVSLLGSVLMMSVVSDKSRYPELCFWACALYSYSLMFLFLFSCLFHSFFMMPETYHIFIILDHVAIYMLIAGSYTPYLLLGLPASPTARTLVVVEWVAAIGGSMFAAVADFSHPSTSYIELVMFVTMGLAVVSIWQELLAAMDPPALLLLLLGGAAYLGGIPFFLNSKVPISHTFWHLCVMVAALLHWLGIYLFVLPLAATA